MSCPTCGHTMAMLFDSRERTVWHCGRCGTVRSQFLGHTDDVVPKLVERCRTFYEYCGDFGAHLREKWCSLGIAESIGPPEAAP